MCGQKRDWIRRLKEVTHPLPGAQPYHSIRPMSVGEAFDGLSLLDFLDRRHPHVGRIRWRDSILAHRIVVDGRVVGVPEVVVRGGNQIVHHAGLITEPDVATDMGLVFEDEHILVIDKPAPLPVHPCGRFNRHTLLSFLSAMYPDRRFRTVHRLDADTTGLLLVAKHRAAARNLTRQFEGRRIEKTYLARVRGTPARTAKTITHAVAERTLEGGTRALSDSGSAAATRVVLRRQFGDQTALIEAVPLTGRTNQIRLHLASEGLPIVGDLAYGRKAIASAGRESDLGRALSAAPICLHAWRLAFIHPGHAERFELESELPIWAKPDQSSV